MNRYPVTALSWLCLLATVLYAPVAIADVIVLSSPARLPVPSHGIGQGADARRRPGKTAILGHIREETNGCLLVDVEQGQFSINKNLIDYMSRSQTPQDTYLAAARRLIQEHQPALAVICLDRSIQEEPATRAEAISLRNSLAKTTIKNASRQAQISYEDSYKKAAELRKKGEILVRAGEAAKKAGAVDPRTIAAREQLAEKQIAEGQKLLARAKQIEDRLRAQEQAQVEKPKPFYRRLPAFFKRLFVSQSPEPERRTKTRSHDFGLKNISRSLIVIGLGVAVVLFICYLLFRQH